MSSDTKTNLIVYGVIILIVATVVFLIAGPQGCKRQISGWSASAYGSDWLVVHYAQDGSVINYWELKNESIGNEKESDGIYFIEESGNVVHLSGHYVYIQIKNDSWEAAKKQLKVKKGGDEL